MTKTLTVEGDIIAVDTITSLTTQGSVTAPSLVTPSGVRKIDKLIVGVAAELAAAGDAGYHVRLNGSAVLKGEQVITVAAQGGQLPQAGSDQATSGVIFFELDDVDIDVVGSEVITIQGEMAGDGLGTARMIVTLIFS